MKLYKIYIPGTEKNYYLHIEAADESEAANRFTAIVKENDWIKLSTEKDGDWWHIRQNINNFQVRE
ncbi:MAG TPA: hypothetical protein ENI23_10815 [bacterium]|nr:hypothetical protein [bacterium]